MKQQNKKTYKYKNKKTYKHKNKTKCYKKRNKQKFVKKNITSKRRRTTNRLVGGESLDFENINHVIPNYSTFYIAIGAKYHSYEDYPISMNTGLNQLFPEFLNYYLHTGKTLLIIIDIFNTRELEENKSMLNDKIESSSSDDKIDYIFINKHYDTELQTTFINNLLQQLTLEQNIIVCNYVNFFNEPNIQERQILSELDFLLNQLQLDFSKKFNKSVIKLPKNQNVYKWFGKSEPNYVCLINLYDMYFNIAIPALKSGDFRKAQNYIKMGLLKIT